MTIKEIIKGLIKNILGGKFSYFWEEVDRKYNGVMKDELQC